jgi:serine/threonine protein kinase
MTRTPDSTNQVESPVPPGTVVDGHRIERIISVRAGVHTLADATAPSGEHVTLKLLAPSQKDKHLRRRASKLRGAQASIHHPHVLPQLGKGKPRDCIRMRGVAEDTVTLAERLRHGPLPPTQALELLSQVAGALEMARELGLVHRELAPGAILVTADDPPKALLTDFGVAVPDAPGCTVPGSVEDADYRSPEEIRGEAPRSASNVYSLACILVACLTGAPPYPYDRPLLTVRAHLMERPPRVSKRNSELPPELDNVVDIAMAKDPVKRYRSPAVFMRACREALGITEAAAPAPPKPRAVAPAEPKQRPAALAEAKPRPAERPAPPAPKPEAKKAPPPHASAGKEARPHTTKRARRPRTARSGRWRSVRRLAPTWAGVALLASALAGFATGSSSDPPAPVAPSEEAARPTPASTPPIVAPVIDRLDKRRTAARRRLQAARLPAKQAAIARRLARIYAGARAALVRAPGTVSLEEPLAARLRGVERAYRELALAAQRGNARGWRAASDTVLDRERDLELLLRTNRWT